MTSIQRIRAVIGILVACLVSASSFDARSPAAVTYHVPIALDLKQFRHETVMFISAHPDDIEYTVGGTIVRLIKEQGARIVFVIVTNGDKGCSNIPMCQSWNMSQLASARAQEAMGAAAILGLSSSDVYLLGYEDANVTAVPEMTIRQDLVYLIRTTKPFAVMSWYPYARFDLLSSNLWSDMGYHPDHQAVGKVALDAQFDAGLGRLFPDSGAPWRVSQFYMWDFVNPSHYVDIDSAISTKTDAYLAHKTQVLLPPATRALIQLQASRIANSTFSGSKLAESFKAFF